MGNSFSFMGYPTKDRGLHGIHYKKLNNQFYFGTRNNEIASELFWLTDNQRGKIPAIIKATFLEVANSKKNIMVKKSQWEQPL